MCQYRVVFHLSVISTLSSRFHSFSFTFFHFSYVEYFQMFSSRRDSNQSINRLNAVLIVCISFLQVSSEPSVSRFHWFSDVDEDCLALQKKSSQCHHRKRGPGCADCARSSPACRDAVMPSASGSKPAKSRIRVSRFRLSRLIPQNLSC